MLPFGDFDATALPEGVETTIFSLERYNRKLPEKVGLPVGG